jgi:hypothetical protein
MIRKTLRLANPFPSFLVSFFVTSLGFTQIYLSGFFAM